MKIIQISDANNYPKYQQIINSVERSIANQLLKKNDKLPSINKICLEFGISRDTVLYAYEELKKKGLVYSVLGKGYYVKTLDWDFEERIFLLFDELNAFKEILYHSFTEAVKNRAKVDVFFHYFNIEVFRKLIEENNGNYTKYIIMPSNINGTTPLIKLLPKNEVFILDQTNPELKDYASVHQNFAKDMFNGLFDAKAHLELYSRLVLIFPGKKEPIGMVEGFLNFCNKYKLNYTIISDFYNDTIKIGDMFVIIDDKHLVNVILQSKKQKFKIRRDFGIISYNDTPLKSVVADGISTISTDFYSMGKTLAEMVLESSNRRVENPSHLMLRKSI